MLALDVGGSADGSFDQIVVSSPPGTRVPIIVAGDRADAFAHTRIDDAFAPPPRVLLRSDGVELALDVSLFADGFE